MGSSEHDVRTGFHPDQFVVLNSPDPDVVARSLEDLEAQVAHAVEQAEALALAGPDVLPIDEDRDPDVRDLVRRGLRQQGYRRVYVLEVTPEGKALVEAERGGITAKGLAWVEPDGQVVMRSQLSHRAFP